jgi:AraC-like DNA-binding protein
VSLRTLQRRLREHVGVGPKALLKRLRLQEAAARLAEGEPLADLAYALGYCDQAHFARDFTEAVGHPPGRYAAMARG